MPTKQQLMDIWDFQFHFFKGDPEIVGYPKSNKPIEFTGKKIGHYEYDHENEDLKIVIDPEPEAEIKKDLS